jgi:hypothetical protein
MYEIRTIIPNEFSIYLRKVLDEAHISWDDVLDKEVNINIQHVRKESKDVNTKNLEETNDQRNNFRENALNTNLKKRPSKCKYGDSEFYTGRIQYMLPVSRSISRQNSICSDDTSKSLCVFGNELLENSCSSETEANDTSVFNHELDNAKSNAILDVIPEDDNKSENSKVYQISNRRS